MSKGNLLLILRKVYCPLCELIERVVTFYMIKNLSILIKVTVIFIL